MKTCYFCKGPIQKKHIDYMAQREGRYTLVRHLAAEVCAQCGEIYLDEQSSRKIDAALSRTDTAEEHIDVPVVSLR